MMTSLPKSQILTTKKKISMRKIEEIIKKRGEVQINKDLKLFIDNVRRLELKELELKRELSNMKKNELDRINKEFVSKFYERRFNVSKETIVSVIVGESFAGSELIKLNRDQKVKLCFNLGFLW